MTPEAIAERLGLSPLGFEGGFYRETHRSPQASAIFYMLTPETRSLMHRLKADEVYHFYRGDPVDLLLVRPDGSAESVRLGPDLMAGHRVQQVVPAGVWQGSSLVAGGRFALMGTTMAPGFELQGFELGRRSLLTAEFPHVAARLLELTPEVVETPRLELTAATRDLLHAELRGPDPVCAGLAAAGTRGWDPRSPSELRALIAEFASDSEASWRSWYLIDRADRAVVGTACFSSVVEGGETRLSVGAPPELVGEAQGALAARALAISPAVVRVLAEGRIFERGADGGAG